MRIESPSFTAETYEAIVEGYFERERAELIRRLRAVVGDIEALVPALEGTDDDAGDEWNPIETLAHLPVAAQFFGWVIHEISKGNDIGGQMLELMNLRDPSILEAKQQPPAALVQQLREAVDRATAFLEQVPFEDLRNTIGFANKHLSGHDFVRISMVHHLEDHVEQIRRGLDRG